MDYEEFDNAKSFEHLFMAEPENAKSIVQFDAEYYEENQENPNQETSTGFPKSDTKQYFTFDDVPPSKWRERSIEMLTLCTAELQYYTIDIVIKRFLTGSKDVSEIGITVLANIVNFRYISQYLLKHS
nr:hypothetical protein [Tanacetum cinerariifolium]